MFRPSTRLTIYCIWAWLRNSPTYVGSNRPQPVGPSAMIVYAVPGFTSHYFPVVSYTESAEFRRVNIGLSEWRMRRWAKGENSSSCDGACVTTLGLWKRTKRRSSPSRWIFSLSSLIRLWAKDIDLPAGDYADYTLVKKKMRQILKFFEPASHLFYFLFFITSWTFQKYRQSLHWKPL